MRGFGALELIIALSIISIITIIAVISFSGFNQNNLLNNDANNLVSFMREARSKTLSSENFYQYGINFASSTATLFKGEIFSESDTDNIELLFSDQIEISSLSLNGGASSTVFLRLTGETNEFGSLILSIKSDSEKTKTIRINQAGIVEIL